MSATAVTSDSPTLDVSGTPLEEGDTVVTVNGQSTGKVIEIRREDDVHFVCLRPTHQSYGKGVWYASDQVFWVARPGGGKKDEGAEPAKADTKPAPSTKRREPARKK